MPIKGLNAEITETLVEALLQLMLGSELDGTPDLYDVVAEGFDSSGISADIDGGILEVLNYVLAEALGSEFDGSPDLYDTIVTGYDTTSSMNPNGSILERLHVIIASQAVENRAYTSDSATVNTITDAGLTGTDDFYNGYMIIPLNGTYQGQARYVYDYDGTSKILYVAPNFTGDPDSGGNFDYILINRSAAAYFLDQSGHGLQSIFDIVDAIPDLTRVGGTHDQSDAAGTEDTVWIMDAPGGNFVPKRFVIDLSELAAGDDLDVNIYYRIESGGSYVLESTELHEDDLAVDLISYDLHENRFGIKITTTMDAGTARDFPWEVYYEG